MMSTKKIGSLLGTAALLLGSACADLEVTNPNNPDIKRALASASDVQSLARSSVNSWYLTSTYIEPFIMMCVTADACTGNFGNFGMRFNNLEPRSPYNNSSAASDGTVASSSWDNNYGTLGSANDVLRAMDNGVVLATPALTEQHRQLALFAQAASLMNLGLAHDKAFVVDEKTDLSAAPELKPYKDVSAAAAAKWDALITNLNGKTASIDPTILPLTTVTFSQPVLQKIANTMAAMNLAYTPRTSAEAGQVNWAKVLQHANAGIDFDVTVQGDNTSWYSYINYYGNEQSWVRVDMRLINMMDPTQCPTYTGASCIKPADAAADLRLTSDYNYHGAVIGDPSRGIFMQSPWSHKRYVGHSRFSPTSARTPVPYILKAENDLLIAEALVRTNGDLNRAATLINNTRVTRGGRTPVTAASGTAALLAAIRYERAVELLNTNGMELFRFRQADMLQAGTVKHLPIPAKELETLRIALYTFGGPGKEMSITTSDIRVDAFAPPTAKVRRGLRPVTMQ